MKYGWHEASQAPPDGVGEKWANGRVLHITPNWPKTSTLGARHLAHAPNFGPALQAQLGIDTDCARMWCTAAAGDLRARRDHAEKAFLLGPHLPTWPPPYS